MKNFFPQPPTLFSARPSLREASLSFLFFTSITYSFFFFFALSFCFLPVSAFHQVFPSTLLLMEAGSLLVLSFPLMQTSVFVLNLEYLIEQFIAISLHRGNWSSDETLLFKENNRFSVLASSTLSYP